MGRNDTKTTYNITRQLSGRMTNTSKLVKYRDGNVIRNTGRTLLNGDDIADALDLTPCEDFDVDTGQSRRTKS